MRRACGPRDEAAGTTTGDDEKTAILFVTCPSGQEVIGPMPDPVEGLEDVRVAGCLLEQGVPFGFKGLEAGARGDHLELIGLGHKSWPINPGIGCAGHFGLFRVPFRGVGDA